MAFGKGVIGALRLSFCTLVLTNKFCMCFHHHVPSTKKTRPKHDYLLGTALSTGLLLNDGLKSHVDKDRRIHEH